MSKKILLFMIIASLSITMIACSTDIQEKVDHMDRSKPEDNIYPENPINQDEDMEKEKDPIKEKINSMTIDEKIGQLVIVGLDGYHMDDYITTMIEDYHIGGVILFSRNIKDANQLIELMDLLKKANGNQIPLFLSIDQEGGRVSRMPKDILNTPSNREIGRKNNPEYAYEVARTIGGVLDSFGFNMNFAPVLDIDSNPKNPVIGDRSFGPDGNIVGKMGVEIMDGLKSQNIISVVKHFPGHGDTSMDSHVNIPRIYKDMDAIMDFEILPFKKAIDNHVDAVMISHILFDKIDPQNPATLSKVIINDLLRERLKFNGIVITDDMSMGAILENYSIDQAAVKSILAGTDIVLLSHGDDNKVNVLEGLKEAVINNEITMERLDESLYRILKLKEKYDIF